MVLDSKLNFQSHVREVILKARRGVGIIRYISKYVSRNVLDQIYKLYVRPHLDYGIIIYHRNDPDMRLNMTKRLEQTQYHAALAVAGVWKGTNRQKLYNELGWEDLYYRRWYRRLCHFYNLRKTGSPGYLFAEIPNEREQFYNLRHTHVYEQFVGRTIHFSHTYFQNALYEWNNLDQDIKTSQSISEFKRKLLAIIRPTKKSYYDIFDIEGVKKLTKLRVNFSALNGHRYTHNFESSSPICMCGEGIEDNKHFLLHCHLFDWMRRDLFRQLTFNVNGIDIRDLDSNVLCNLLLFGSNNLTIFENRTIIEGTILSIKAAKRLE